jgi:uncharacterized protein
VPGDNQWVNTIIPSRLPVDGSALEELCRRRGILRLSLFGSQLTGLARPDSDIDLLVEFGPGIRVSLLDLAEVEAELSALLGGRKVDLRTPAELSRSFRDEVLRKAQPQYVAA